MKPDTSATTPLKPDQAMNHAVEAALEAAADHAYRLRVRRIGVTRFVGSDIVRVEGLAGVEADELLEFEDGSLGVAFNLDTNEIGVVLVRQGEGLAAGMETRTTGRVLDCPVGDAVLGRVLDPLGRPLDDSDKPETDERRPIERPAPAIMDRAPVAEPMQTGIKVVDALLPIGRGQRELVLGDRQTGKTALCIDAMINQRENDVVCIYCAIGKRGQAVSKAVDDLKQYGRFERCVVVAATENDPAGLQYAAPYAAMTMAEYFMQNGRDVLLALDDLTRHARAYRQVSLLLRRPPGREAYPGDIFYIHSRLLERSTHLREEHGGGSITTLPVIETEAQNVSAYIPTNLISITDGQIYLSPKLFRKGLLPPVEVGTSVSRVGGKAQLPAYRAVAGDLRLTYSQFEELESFARFGTRLDEDTAKTLARGRRVREVLKQEQYDTRSVPEQIITLVAVNQGLFDDLETEAIGDAEKKLRQAVHDKLPDLCTRMTDGESIRDEDIESLKQVARKTLGLEQPEEGEE